MAVGIEITFQSSSSLGGSPLWHSLEQATEALDCDVRVLSVHMLVLGPADPHGFPELQGQIEALALHLPRCRWSPKTGRLRLEYVTRHHVGRDPRMGISPSEFRAQLAELAEQLEAQADRLRQKKSGPDVHALIGCLRALEARVPETQAEFSEFLAEAFRAGEARHARLPWWEQLEVRWQDWHPTARERLDDRLFWEQEADVAPHGNDTGADLLRAYRRRRSRVAGGVAFLDALLRRWQIPTDWRARPSDQWTADDETWILTWDEAVIALAFAQIKLEGECEDAVRALALEAIDRSSSAAERFGWRPRPERDAPLLRMRQALLPAGPDL